MPIPDSGQQPRNVGRPIEQRTVRSLGLLSLMTVYALALAAAFLPDGSPAAGATFHVLVGYVAALLAFLGAVHWGAALAAAPDAARGRQSLRWGVLPLVLGTAALALAALGAAPGIVLGLLAIDLGLCLVADITLARASPVLPDWFLALRRRWTVGAIVALGLAALALV